MKKTVIKLTVFVVTFVVSLVVIGKLMNQGHDNMTMEMSPATFPIVTMVKDGMAYNELHGYRNSMDVAFQRDSVTELGANREASFVVETFGTAVNGISIEVRTTDGERLIEDSAVTDYEVKDGKIYADIALKDLIEQEKEYVLTILLEESDGNVIRYYTKVIWSEHTYAAQKMKFVRDFHDKLYDKEAAKELIVYLESNSQGDNTSLHKVDIHSSFQQITWGDLEVTEVGEPVLTMTELASQTASFLLNYMVTSTENGKETYYRVEEYYRVRYVEGGERMYLLDYERTMTQLPDMENMYANDKILLGIVGEDIPMVESGDGNIVVFEVAKQLCCYNITSNKLSIIFSFYNGENADTRAFYGQHDLKILDVDEGGAVRFAVYGYMNRGRHEGEVGIQIYHYDSSMNTIEEVVYIPYDKTYAVLEAEMEQVLYQNRDEKLYLFLENVVYGVDLAEKTYQEILTVNRDGSLQVSENHRILVWQEEEDIYHSRQLMVKNLNTGVQNVIVAGEGELIRPLGFMGEDIIYGIAREADVRTDNIGRVFYPMYKICIQNSNGDVLKEYEQDNVYVIQCQVVDNQITLERMERDENGNYSEIAPDHIMNNVEVAEGKNKIVTANIEKYQKYVQIQMRNTIDGKSLKVLTPKEVVFEGGRTLELGVESTDSRYYVYGAYGVEGIYNAPAEAVNLAYEISGVVMDNNGQCVWMKGNRVTRNQIMAIKEKSATEENSSLAVCLNTIFELEGLVRNAQYLLNQGQTVMEIMEDNLENAQILDLTGCSLDAILYYVNQDIPILATLEDGNAVLITGFNEFNVVIMEPSTGKLYKKGMNDSIKWFEENGNCFITYLRE